MRVRLLTAIVLIAALPACFSSKPPASSSSEIPAPSAGLAPNIFPHKSDWGDPDKHGVYVKDVLDMDATTCLGCHKETESISGGAPSCRSCHKLFPHTDPGVTSKNHGDYVLKNGKAACATTCHGTDLKGGLSGVPCTQCHGSYPHDSGWATPGVHGPKAQGDLKLKNNCNLCHGDDWKGGISKSSCIDCHKGLYPHPAGWASPDQHGAFVTTNGSGKCATQCHGVQLEGGLSGKSCGEGCHKVWPHIQGWKAQHGQTARTLGLSSCTGCHKNDATGGKTGVSCAKCHNALPAHQDADWVKGGHGKLVTLQPTSLTDPTGCPLCHGAKLEGGKLPTSPLLKPVRGCNDSSCHATFPQLHTPAAGAPAWNSYAGHGKWLLNQVNTTQKVPVMEQITSLIAECKLCHGSDLKGGNTGKSCYVSGCHTSFPHNSDPTATPWLSKHGAVASAETPKAASCATSNCHGLKLEGSTFNGKKLVKACNDCHLQMPHQATWLKTHGASAMVDPNTCVKCHGSNWMGSGNSPSCYNSGCHSNYPLPHRNADGSKNIQWKPAAGTDFHGTLVKNAAGATTKDKVKTLKCTTCHDNGNPENPTPSCYSCHQSFPHAPEGVVDWKTGHKAFIAGLVANSKLPTTPFEVIKTECAPCHISAGPPAKNDCASCHHKTAPDWKTKAQHGAAAIKDVAGCKTCHGQELNDGTLTNGKTCVTCHGPGTKATMSSHQDVQTGTVSVCVEENDMEECVAWVEQKVFDYFVKSEPYYTYVAGMGGKQKKIYHTTFHMHQGLLKTNPIATAADLKSCQICHGSDLKGGISGKTCVVEGSCHDPGNRYKNHSPAQKMTWLQQMAAQGADYTSTLNKLYPNGMSDCWSTCHKVIYPAVYGKIAFSLDGDCLGCHKGFNPP